MQTIILHGENVEKSYQRLKTFVSVAKKRNWEIVYDDSNPTSSLFAKEKLIVIRDYKQSLAGGAGKLLPKKFDNFEGTLVIYHEGNIPASILKSFKDAKRVTDFVVEKFELPQLLWGFLNKPTVKLLHEVIKTNALEFVFIMLFRNLKKKKRYDLVNELAQIDIDYKTGKVDLPLALDLFVAKNLQ